MFILKIFRCFFIVIFGKEVKEMAVIYATLIVKGKKKFADVPALIQVQVREVLVDLDVEYLATED